MPAPELLQALPIALVYKLVLIVMLSAFMVITAWSFLNTRVKKKQAAYARTIGFLGVGDDRAAFATRAVIDEYDRRSYVVPVATATMVTLFGMVSLMFAPQLVGTAGSERNALLTALFPDTGGGLDGLRWQSMVVLTLAFLGAYVWSCHNIIRRLIAGDLAPVEYYNTSLRLIFAPLLSLMLAFLFEAAGAGPTMRQSLPVIAFMTGMLPGAALQYLEENFARLLKLSETSADPLRLGMVEGINRHHAVRLGEVGIDNAQNLACANIVELILKTPFKPDQLLDWIGQARLYVAVKDQVLQLRRYGIRTAFDLAELAADEERLIAIGHEAGVNPLALVTIAQQIGADPQVRQLLAFRRRLTLDAGVDGPEATPLAGDGAHPAAAATTARAGPKLSEVKARP